jgi:alpha-tubulin suppressor-like RCC1 family protein
LNTKAEDIDRTDEVNELTEMLLVVPRNESSLQNDEPESIHAGGGHSALLTSSGHLYLWGWNEAGQLGRKGMFYNEAPSSSLLSPIQPLGIKVETVSLGHTHTLVIEKVLKSFSHLVRTEGAKLLALLEVIKLATSLVLLMVWQMKRL